MTPEGLRQQLEGLADAAYRDFAAKLLPPNVVMLGVRLPQLRRMAQDLAKSDWLHYLKTAKDDSFEEILLQGMTIGGITCPPAQRLDLIAAFIPKLTTGQYVTVFVPA